MVILYIMSSTRASLRPGPRSELPVPMIQLCAGGSTDLHLRISVWYSSNWYATTLFNRVLSRNKMGNLPSPSVGLDWTDSKGFCIDAWWVLLFIVWREKGVFLNTLLFPLRGRQTSMRGGYITNNNIIVIIINLIIIITNVFIFSGR